MSGNHVGRLSKLYFNTGTYLNPTWVEVKKIGDVDIEDGGASSDRDSRESGNTKTIMGNHKFGLKFEYNKVRGIVDPVLQMILKSRAQKTCIDTLALDNAITVVGSEGLRGPFVVTANNKKEPINDQETYSTEMAEGLEYDSSGEIVDVERVAVGQSGLAAKTFA